MGVLSWILSGLVLGSIAPLVLPGRAPGGLAGTVGIGVAGAVVGGLIGTIAGFSPITDFEFRSFLLGITGAIGLLFVFRLYVDRAEA